MDVTSPATLADKPSIARHHDRPQSERRHSALQRALALILANAMFWQPLLVQAQENAGIVASNPATQVGQAGNGVPVVNIAAPNASGLSHNQYQQYNVDANGLILNNATGATQSTQLGGIILGNPNLQGQAAGVILNEVTGANASQLKGYTEVAGQAAKVIVANPHGITCNGCGFINTPQATLTTGKPVLDAGGQLQRFNVQGGSVAIEGAGLNASNVEQFDIITRSAKINAQLHANKLNVVTGRNDVDANTLAATPLADDGSSKPELAIDSSALGGMYAGAVKLVGTEAGVGVKLAGDLAASGGDIQIDANGKLTLGQSAASGNIVAKAQDIDVSAPMYAGAQVQLKADKTLTNRKSVAAGQAVTLQAGQLNNNGVIEAGVNSDNSRNTSGDVNLTAGNLNNQGTVIASRALTASATRTLDNQNGKLLSEGSLNLDAKQLDNRKGQISSAGPQTLAVSGTLNNSAGKVLTDSTLTVTGGTLNNDTGILSAAQSLVIDNTRVINRSSGEITSGTTLNLKSRDLDNLGGLMSGRGVVTVNAERFTNSGTLVGNTTVSLTLLERLTNSGGKVVSGGDLLLDTPAQIDNSNGRLSSQGLLTILAGQLDNTRQGVVTASNVNITATGISNQNGTLYSQGLLQVRGTRLDNTGGQIAASQLDFGLSGVLNNRQGVIESSDSLLIDAASLENQQGQISALGTAGSTQLKVTGVLDNSGGRLQSASQGMGFALGRLSNSAGTITHAGGGSLGLSLALLQNAGGTLSTTGTLSLSGDSWSNSTTIQAANLDLDIGTLTQLQGGQLLATGSFTGRGQNWTNDGLIATDGDLSLTLSGHYNGTGRLIGLGNLNLTAASLNISGDTARIAGGGDTTIDINGILQNSARISAINNLRISAATLNNQGTLAAGSTLGVNAQALLNRNGLITSGADMLLLVNNFTNQNAAVYSLGNLQISRDAAGSLADSIINRSGDLTSDGSLVLAAESIQNIRDVLTVNDAGIYSAQINEIACGTPGVGNLDCSGGKEHHVWNIQQLEKLEVTQASKASSITSGGNITLRGVNFLNSSSTLASAGTLDAVFSNDFSNVGVVPSTTRTSRTFVSQRTRSPGGWYSLAQNFNQRYSQGGVQYDASNLSGLEAAMSNFIATTEREVTELRSIDRQTPDGQLYAAVIQAGGAVSIEAGNNFDSSAVQRGFTYVSGGLKTDTSTGSGYSSAIRLDSQLSPDLTQQQINPTTLPGFSLPTGQNGLFHLAGQASDGAQLLGNTAAGSHPYLIETNPALTDMRQFLSSNYLLGNLGYNPDTQWKRLGDGYYEQRLIQQAVVARTGQRYLAGLTSDEATFKYLMDNALASRDALNLSVGVSLTGEQVAALTHDIVWMEEQQVQGQRVLVPVLYMAQANNRLAANGALIQGSDLQLIAGNTLNNAGTLLARNDLSAKAGNNLINSGLIQTQQRLALHADNNLLNHAGGVITGRDVSLTAKDGSVTNERTVTSHQSATGASTWREDFADNAARVEAAGNLIAKAGQDVNNIGGVMQAQGAVGLEAGRDVNIVAAQTQEGRVNGPNHSRSSVTQLAASVSAGQNIGVQTVNDINVIASQIEAQGNLVMNAGNNLNIVSAANESQYYSKTKKVTAQQDHTQQVASILTADGNVALSAGQDMTVSSSQVKAGNDAYLYAGKNLNLLAEQNYDYSLYDMKKKGSFGAKQTQRDEVTDIRHVGTQITTGGNLLLTSGGDQRYQAAQLNSGRDLTLESGGAITFEGVKDLHQESHEKSKSDLAWNSMEGKGRTDETVRQTQMIAQGELAIRAVNGLQIDVKQVDQQTVSQAIDAMVQADPQLAWLKDAERRGDVDWRQVKELHDSFKYSHSGLGAGAQLVIAIVMAVVVGPAAMGALGGAGTAVAAGGSAIATSAATTATISVINNRGNLGAVFKDVTSSDSLKGYAIAGVTAGLTAGYFDEWTGTKTDIATGKVIGPKLYTLKGVGQFAANQTLQNGTSYLLGKALGQKGSANEALKSALFNTLAAASFNAVGDYTREWKIENGTPSKIAIHATVGGLLSMATGGDFTTGALAAGANEALVVELNKLVKGDERLLTMSSQIVGLLAAASQDDVDAEKLNKAAWVAKNGTQYNFLGDHSAKQRDEAREKFREDGGLQEARALVKLEGSDHRSDNLLKAYKENPASLKADDLAELTAYLQVYAYEQTLARGEEAAQSDLAQLLNDSAPTDYPYAGRREDRLAWADAERAKQDGFVSQLAWTRDKTLNEQTYNSAKGFLQIEQEQQGLSNIGSPALYFLSGPVGSGVRAIAATQGALQFGQGVKQATEGDTWNAAGNMVFGALGMASVRIPTRVSVNANIARNEASYANLTQTGKTGTAAESATAKSLDSKLLDPCCFAAGTKVSTPNGDRAIETLKIGDIVWSKPEKGGKPFAAAITATHIRNDQPIYRLTLKGADEHGNEKRDTLLVTPSHPFYVPAQKDFIPVSDLKTGDRLQSLADGATENTSSEVESLELYAPVGTTYNLTVDVGHTFYVGELKTWVHNTGPCKWPNGALVESGVGGTKSTATGSGPARGFLEISDAYSSSKAVQGLNNSKPIDFIYDPVSQRFIMGRNQFGHDGILNAGKIPSSDAIVGGGIWKENGVLRTYEWSGHYGMNWTPELREQFKSFMSSHGVSVTHTPGIAR